MAQEEYYTLIKEQYENAKGDFTQLFQTILVAADKIGGDKAWAYLEQCVTEKRLAWLDRNLDQLAPIDDGVLAGYRLFYEVYLGLAVPVDGEIIEQTERKIVTRWWNHCPTLEICQQLGLDTRQICQQVYHRPVQAFLAKINPRLRFDRNYDAIRPYCAYCEEIISLEE
jgi:hypothetical protein